MSQFHQGPTDLLGGVSQVDPRVRAVNQVDEQINCLPEPALGLIRRPPLEHQTVLDAVPANYDGAVAEVIQTRLGVRHRVVITGGDLKVYKVSDNSEVTVSFPNGKGYLTGTDFRLATSGEGTVVLNRDTLVARLAGQTSNRRKPEGLVFIRQGDYSTEYSLTVGPYTVTHTTPASSNAEAREALDTTEIAAALFASLKASSGFNSIFTAQLLGSSIYIQSATLGEDFEVSASDGLADKGILIVRDTVQRFEDLPLEAIDGYQCRVIGDPGSEADDMWVIYDSAQGTDQQGVWLETVAPGEPTKLDPTTLPHELVYDGPWTGKGRVKVVPWAPHVSDTKWEVEDSGWTNLDDSGGTTVLPGGDDTILEEEGSSVRSPVPAATVGNETLISIGYDADTSLVEPSVTTTVVLEFGTSGTQWTEIARQAIRSGENLRDQVLQGTATPVSGDEYRARVEYSTGGTPALTSRAKINFYAPLTSPSTVDEREYSARFLTKYAKFVTFGYLRVWPKGYGVTVTINATPFTHTPATDETGPVVAQAMAALINADAAFVATPAADGLLEIFDGVGTSNPTVTTSYALDPTQHVWLEGLDLTGMTLTGAKLVNLTDGSEATISSFNGSIVALTSPLAGGEDNTFEWKDVVEVRGGSATFVFREAPWVERKVGDLESNPFPGFVGRTLSDVTFYQGRLIFVFDDQAHFSQSGVTYDLHRETVTTLRPSDGFGVVASSGWHFHSAAPWDEDLYLVSNRGLTLVYTDPFLAPNTVGLENVLEIENSTRIRPAVFGTSLVMLRERPQGIQVLQVFRRGPDQVGVGDLTGSLPTYLTGTADFLVASQADTLVLVGAGATIYACRLLPGPEGSTVPSWGQWSLGTGVGVEGATLFDSQLALVLTRPDAATLETMNLEPTL